MKKKRITKSGRRRLAGEKSEAYDKSTVLHGRHPRERWFAGEVSAFAKSKAEKDAPRADYFGASILKTLEAVGAQTDDQQAVFFKNVATVIRTRKEWGPTGVADIRRFLLKSILMIEYSSKEVDLGAVAEQITKEGGLHTDERWVSRESKKLGYKVRSRGRR